MSDIKIPVFVCNLLSRIERRQHIIKEFENKQEYSMQIIPAIKNKIGAYGLWLTLQKIVQIAVEKNYEYFIFCEDDHKFTKYYTAEKLANSVERANKLNADILSGGVSWVKHPIQYQEDLFWMQAFTGAQFTIIYKRMYHRILGYNAPDSVIADLQLSVLSDDKFVMYPFISTQKEFGYSDVTETNNDLGRVIELFENTEKKLDCLTKVYEHYKQIIL